MTAATVGRLSQENVGAAIRRVQQMNQFEKLRIADSIFEKQPNLLASVLVQRKNWGRVRVPVQPLGPAHLSKAPGIAGGWLVRLVRQELAG